MYRHPPWSLLSNQFRAQPYAIVQLTSDIVICKKSVYGSQTQRLFRAILTTEIRIVRGQLFPFHPLGQPLCSAKPHCVSLPVLVLPCCLRTPPSMADRKPRDLEGGGESLGMAGTYRIPEVSANSTLEWMKTITSHCSCLRGGCLSLLTTLCSRGQVYERLVG